MKFKVSKMFLIWNRCFVHIQKAVVSTKIKAVCATSAEYTENTTSKMAATALVRAEIKQVKGRQKAGLLFYFAVIPAQAGLSR